MPCWTNQPSAITVKPGKRRPAVPLGWNPVKRSAASSSWPDCEMAVNLETNCISARAQKKNKKQKRETKQKRVRDSHPATFSPKTKKQLRVCSTRHSCGRRPRDTRMAGGFVYLFSRFPHFWFLDQVLNKVLVAPSTTFFSKGLPVLAIKAFRYAAFLTNHKFCQKCELLASFLLVFHSGFTAFCLVSIRNADRCVSWTRFCFPSGCLGAVSGRHFAKSASRWAPSPWRPTSASLPSTCSIDCIGGWWPALTSTAISWSIIGSARNENALHLEGNAAEATTGHTANSKPRKGKQMTPEKARKNPNTQSSRGGSWWNRVNTMETEESVQKPGKPAWEQRRQQGSAVEAVVVVVFVLWLRCVTFNTGLTDKLCINMQWTESPSDSQPPRPPSPWKPRRTAQ